MKLNGDNDPETPDVVKRKLVGKVQLRLGDGKMVIQGPLKDDVCISTPFIEDGYTTCVRGPHDYILKSTKA